MNGYWSFFKVQKDEKASSMTLTLCQVFVRWTDGNLSSLSSPCPIHERGINVQFVNESFFWTKSFQWMICWWIGLIWFSTRWPFAVINSLLGTYILDTKCSQKSIIWIQKTSEYNVKWATFMMLLWHSSSFHCNFIEKSDLFFPVCVPRKKASQIWNDMSK